MNSFEFPRARSGRLVENKAPTEFVQEIKTRPETHLTQLKHVCSTTEVSRQPYVDADGSTKLIG